MGTRFAHSKSCFLVPQFNSALGFFNFASFLLMAELRLGPISIRYYKDETFNNIVCGYKGKHGLETAAQVGIKSQHLTYLQGEDNPEDTLVCGNSGKTYFGKKGITPVSAQQVYAIEMAKLAEQAQIEASRKVLLTPTAQQQGAFPVAC